MTASALDNSGRRLRNFYPCRQLQQVGEVWAQKSSFQEEDCSRSAERSKRPSANERLHKTTSTAHSHIMVFPKDTLIYSSIKPPFAFLMRARRLAISPTARLTKQQMANGRQQMANGTWRMASGKWQMAYSKRQPANRKLQMADSKWQTAHGKWQTANGKCRRRGVDYTAKTMWPLGQLIRISSSSTWLQ